MQIGKEYFWTDSKVVLGYINNDARRFHTFVVNRVQKIRHITSPKQWFYIPTNENPASRVKTVNELLASNWFTGPTFLCENEIPTPKDVVLYFPLRRSRSQKGTDSAIKDCRFVESC